MNIKKYYIYQFFNELMPIYPLYLLLFESKDISLTQISLLLAIWSIATLMLEIPSGILADRFSRKKLIVIGGVLKALCYITWIISSGFLLFAVGFVFWGLSCSLHSGTEEALLYDSLKTEGKEQQFDLVLGKGRFFAGISTIVSSLVGGIVGEYFGFETALFISIIMCIVTVIIASSYHEINYHMETCIKDNDDQKQDTLRQAFLFLILNKKVLIITMLSILVIGIVGVLDEYDQLIAKNYGLSVSFIGIWMAIRFLVMSVGSLVARGWRLFIKHFFRTNDRMKSIIILSIISSISLGLAGLFNRMSMITFYAIFYLLMSAGEILVEDYIQQKIDLEGRATVHSIISFTMNLYAILFYIVFGFVASKTTIHMALVFVSIYIFIWVVVFSIFYKVYVSKKNSA